MLVLAVDELVELDVAVTAGVEFASGLFTCMFFPPCHEFETSCENTQPALIRLAPMNQPGRLGPARNFHPPPCRVLSEGPRAILADPRRFHGPAIKLDVPCETHNESTRKFFSISALCNAGKSFASST